MSSPNRCIPIHQRASSFARKIADYKPVKIAAKELNCSQDTIKKIRSGSYTPGLNLIERWRVKFGEAFDLYLIGKEDEAEAALIRDEARELLKRLDVLEGKQ